MELWGLVKYLYCSRECWWRKTLVNFSIFYTAAPTPLLLALWQAAWGSWACVPGTIAGTEMGNKYFVVQKLRLCILIFLVGHWDQRRDYSLFQTHWTNVASQVPHVRTRKGRTHLSPSFSLFFLCFSFLLDLDTQGNSVRWLNDYEITEQWI